MFSDVAKIRFIAGPVGPSTIVEEELEIGCINDFFAGFWALSCGRRQFTDTGFENSIEPQLVRNHGQ